MAATESKYITLAKNILLEYVYDEDNLKQEDYHIINNLNIDEKGYCSKTGQNKLENQVFPIDPVVKKYAKVDQDKYNYLKIGNFQTSYVHFDKVRLHLPTTYSFVGNDYIGLYVKIYAFDYINKKTVNLASYLYDDTEVGADKNFVFNEEFMYDQQQWGKYLTFDIPSVYEVSRQRTNSIDSNLPTTNSVNINLSNYGLNQETPIFFDFSWVISRQELLGSTYYFFSDLKTKSIANKPEYQTLGVQVEESSDGDYFEIYGTYNQSNESLDDWVDEMTTKGRKMKIEYQITLYEENILTNQQVFTVIENFTKKILYRPIITFSNTVASINVEMKVIDLFDNSQIIKFASIGLKNNIFKYGRTLNRINIDNAYKPKIYNQKVLSIGSDGPSQNIPDIDLTKVNFPVIVDRIKVLTSASPSNGTEYKGMGLSEIIINPFGAVLKFDIAADIDNDGVVTPYDLTKITENSTVTLSFKDETNFIEKDIWQQTDENNFELGTILFKIDEGDLPSLKAIYKNNKNFYLTIKGDKTGVRTLLYSGKFVFFEDISFLNSSGSGTNSLGTNFDYNDFSDLGLSKEEINNLLNDDVTSGGDTNKNLFIFLNNDAITSVFETYLSSINADIYFSQAGGNDTCLTFMYFILNVTPALITDIKIRPEVMKVVEMEFCLGKGKTGTGVINIDDINASITSFNCANTQLK